MNFITDENRMFFLQKSVLNSHECHHRFRMTCVLNLNYRKRSTHRWPLTRKYGSLYRLCRWSVIKWQTACGLIIFAPRNLYLSRFLYFLTIIYVLCVCVCGCLSLLLYFCYSFCLISNDRKEISSKMNQSKAKQRNKTALQSKNNKQ